MRWLFFLLSILVASILFLGGPASNHDAVGSQASQRIGVFDSRVIPIAFAASDVFDAELSTHGEKIKAAEKAGDDAIVEKLTAMMPARLRPGSRPGRGYSVRFER